MISYGTRRLAMLLQKGGIWTSSSGQSIMGVRGMPEPVPAPRFMSGSRHWFWHVEHGCEWDSETCEFAAKNGDVIMLQWAGDHGCPWGAATCVSAAKYEQFEALVWAHENGGPWYSETCAAAAANGDLRML
jgi:hypothetical protein